MNLIFEFIDGPHYDFKNSKENILIFFTEYFLYLTMHSTVAVSWKHLPAAPDILSNPISQWNKTINNIV